MSPIWSYWSTMTGYFAFTTEIMKFVQLYNLYNFYILYNCAQMNSGQDVSNTVQYSAAVKHDVLQCFLCNQSKTVSSSVIHCNRIQGAQQCKTGAKMASVAIGMSANNELATAGQEVGRGPQGPTNFQHPSLPLVDRPTQLFCIAGQSAIRSNNLKTQVSSRYTKLLVSCGIHCNSD